MDAADQVFYVFEDERFTFAGAWSAAQQVAASLAAMGVGKGDRVGISMRNYPEWIFGYMGITSLGAIAVAMHGWWSGEEMLYGIEDSGLTTLFVDRERLEHLSPYLDERELNVIAVRTGHTSGRGVMSWSSFMGMAGGSPPEPEIAPDDPGTCSSSVPSASAASSPACTGSCSERRVLRPYVEAPLDSGGASSHASSGNGRCREIQLMLDKKLDRIHRDLDLFLPSGSYSLEWQPEAGVTLVWDEALPQEMKHFSAEVLRVHRVPFEARTRRGPLRVGRHRQG